MIRIKKVAKVLRPKKMIRKQLKKEEKMKSKRTKSLLLKNYNSRRLSILRKLF